MDSQVVASPETASGAAWKRRFGWLVLALLGTIAIQFPTYVNLVEVWSGSAAYNHCFLIPLISLYLVFDQRQRLRVLTPDVSYQALAFLALNSVLWLAGNLMFVNVLQHVAAVGFLVGTAWALVGNRVAAAAMFPLGYLYFMVPEGEFLVPHLQDWTATVLVFLLRLTDIPVFLEGRYLQIPSGNFHVAKACSGINYLLATLAVGSMFAYLTYRSNWRRLAFMVLAIMVPLIANGMRAYGIVMIAHLSDYRYAMGVDHFIYGWFFFGIVIFILFAIGRTFSDGGPREPAGPAAPLPAVTTSARSVLPLVGAVFAIVVAPYYAVTRIEQGPPVADGFALPAVPGWEGPGAGDAGLAGSFPGAHRVLTGVYGNGEGETVFLTMVVYLEQRPGAELITHANTIFDPERWRQVTARESGATSVAHTPEVFSRRVRRGNEERLVWWWYQLGERATRSAVSAKAIEALQKMTGRYEGAAIAILATGITPGQREPSPTTLARFLEALPPGRLTNRPDTSR